MLLALLSAGADVNLRTNGKETALHKATRWDQKDVAVLLLKRGALPHFKNGDGKMASAMTADKDLAYICDNFEQWCEEEKQRILKEEDDRKQDARKQAVIDAQLARERADEDRRRQDVRDRRLNGLRGSSPAKR
jgi:ankyrin repeat protein